MAYNLRTGLIGSGDIDVNVSLSGLTADNIQSGIFSLPRIPTLDNSKISDLDAAKLTGTIASGQLNLQGSDIPTLGDSKISELNASKLTGTIASDRLSLITTDIPNLSAAKITSGVMSAARIDAATTLDPAIIPDLSAAKITSGTFA